jgi:demethylmenaquinone methyltransferase/2-methoxy-6-polyprenyl-1,4-benzoquinol methylase
MTAQAPRPALAHAFDTPAAKRRYVQRLFGVIADRYDLITRLLSFGLDQRWKRRLMGQVVLRPGTRVLDLACGTGDLALLLADRGAHVVGLDLTPRMIALARRRPGAGAVRWLVGDMAALPLPALAVDCITTGYGLRNVPDLEGSLREIQRVLRPGGTFCSLDFNRPDNAFVRGIYLAYLTAIGAGLGLFLHGEADTYRYIAASIRRYPGGIRVAASLRAMGFRDVRYLPVLGGLMAIHVASK